MDKTFSPKESRMNSLSCETFGSFSASPGSSICKGDMNRKTSVSLNQRLTPWNSVKLKQEIGLHKYCEWEFLSRKFSSKSFFFFLPTLYCYLQWKQLYGYIYISFLPMTWFSISVILLLPMYLSNQLETSLRGTCV